MKRTSLLSVLLPAFVCAACSSDSDDITVNTPQPSGTSLPLTIVVSERPFATADGLARPSATRAAITKTATLTAFDINYVYGTEPTPGNMTATKGSDGQWTSTGGWPDTDATISWYASTDGTFSLKDDGSNAPYLSFSTDENADSQKDLLVATATASYGDASGSVSFTFDHACTALRFYVKKAKNLADYTLTVSEVKLCNVVKEGDYSFDTASWTLGTPRSSYTLYSGSAKELGTDDYEALGRTDSPYLFLIPQELTAWDGATAVALATSQTYLEIACTITRKADSKAVLSDGKAYIPFAATMERGLQSDVKINIGQTSLRGSDGQRVF